MMVKSPRSICSTFLVAIYFAAIFASSLPQNLPKPSELKKKLELGKAAVSMNYIFKPLLVCFNLLIFERCEYQFLA